jgi:DNA-binding LytR/AlgR family response regulator
MNCIIADDEPLARKRLENFLNEIPFLSLHASCSNASEVMYALAEKKTDLLFLDIQMPKINGISLLKSLPQPPLTIITTAYQDYAIESYELAVTDYLLKPFSFERFTLAVNKAKQQHDLLHQKANTTDPENTYFFVKHNKVYEKIFFNDIIYIEGLQNYVLIHTTERKYTVYLTLKSMEEKLPADKFLKINRSYIVNKHKITGIDGEEIILGDSYLQIGRSFKETVMSKLLGLHLIKR